MSAATKQVCTGYRIKCFCGTLTYMTRDAAHEMWSKIDSRYYVKLRCRWDGG